MYKTICSLLKLTPMQLIGREKFNIHKLLYNPEWSGKVMTNYQPKITKHKNQNTNKSQFTNFNDPNIKNHQFL